MGHSAGGHLALLYAYKAANDETIYNTAMHKINLVISEAGPIHFWKKTGDVTYTIHVDNNICAMLGITKKANNNYSLQELAVLADASPYCVAEKVKESNKILPYTILAYGYGLGSATGEDGDGTVPIQPALDLYNSQTDSQKTLEDLGNNSGCLSSPDNNCVFYYFYEVGHTQFGIGQNKKVYPNPQIDNDDLKAAINDYYGDIKDFMT